MHKRTEVKQRVRALREQLPIGDQTLLMLHVGRRFGWRDLAIVMHDGAELDDEALAWEAARLRKRFERINAELRSLAVAAGLVQVRALSG